MIVFQKPAPLKGSSELAQIIIDSGFVSYQLSQTDRTRVDHADGRAENVAEHSSMLARAVIFILPRLYPDMDIGLAAQFAVIHDDLEAAVGDTPSDQLSSKDAEAKVSLEQAGLDYMLESYQDNEWYCNLIKRYEQQEEPEARAVLILDKITPLLHHLGSGGSCVKQNYDADSWMELGRKKNKALKESYPELDDLVQLHLEMYQLVARELLS